MRRMLDRRVHIFRRRQMAAELGIGEQYLYQILRGLRMPRPALAQKLVEIDPTISLQDLRPHDWQVIWPELCEQNPAAAPATQAPAATKTHAVQDAVHA